MQQRPCAERRERVSAQRWHPRVPEVLSGAQPRVQEAAQKGAQVTANGWTLYQNERPPQGVLVRYKDEVSGEEWTAWELEAWRGTLYLLWKLTGVARESE